MILLTSIQSIMPIILMMVLGYMLRERRFFEEGFSSGMTKLIVNIALPCQVFVSVLKYLKKDELLELSQGLIYTFVSFIILYAISIALIDIRKIKKGRRWVFLNAITNANTVFIGLPLTLALFGEEVLPYYLLYYITNTVSTWGIGSMLLASDAPEQENAKGKKPLYKKIPMPMIGFAISLVFVFFSLPVPAVLHTTMAYLGNMVTPLSLIYIGIALSDAGIKNVKPDGDMIIAIIGRFVLSPLVMMGVILVGQIYLGKMPPLEAQTFIVQSAGPVFASLPILTHEAKGDVNFATGVVTITSILFILVVPLVKTIAPLMG